jgi:hypothetical protein
MSTCLVVAKSSSAVISPSPPKSGHPRWKSYWQKKLQSSLPSKSGVALLPHDAAKAVLIQLYVEFNVVDSEEKPTASCLHHLS